MQFLIHSGAYIDAQDVDGETALHKAAANKNHELTETLLKECPTLAHIRDNKGRLPTEPAVQDKPF